MNVARICAVPALLCALLHSAFAADGQLPLEAPIKIVTAPASSQPAAASSMPEQPAATPTTPGGKLPQYQLGHRQRRIPTGEELQNPSVRFFLALPQATLLIEAMLTIDELPFQAVREQRIERLLKEVAAEPGENVAESSVVARLRQSMQVTGQDPSADEIRWILTNWADGPTLLLLNDNFQRFRARQRPAFAILDRDRDETVSIAEMQAAILSFQECDLNRDDIIQFTEIASAAADVRDVTTAAPAHLMTRLPDASTAATDFQRLAAATSSKDGLPRFDRNGNGRFDDDELAILRESPPDLRLTIAFDSLQPERSRIAVAAVAAEFADAVPEATIDHMGITLSIAGTAVIFQAVQSAASDQVSIGVVNDGYPLLPHLDPSDDGRLTLRELRSLPQRLNAFDANQDGSLSMNEAQPPIRVCFGLGPIVHRELAGIRSVHRGPTPPPPSGPEWFVRMDRNKDNDLARGEFPGTDEQFLVLDADRDELISADEALAFDKQAGKSQSGNPEQPSVSTGSGSTEQAKP